MDTEREHTDPFLDPFLTAVRRRHPDADLVVVPPEPGRPPRPVAGDEELADASQQVGDLADRLWAALDEPVPAGVHWVHGPGDDTVAARSRLVRAVPPTDALDRVEEVLAAAGAGVRRVAGAVERLVGRGPERTRARAWRTTGTGVLVVEVESEPLRTDPERVRALTGGRGRS